jgi:hypothetical protein
MRHRGRRHPARRAPQLQRRGLGGGGRRLCRQPGPADRPRGGGRVPAAVSQDPDERARAHRAGAARTERCVAGLPGLPATLQLASTRRARCRRTKRLSSLMASARHTSRCCGPAARATPPRWRRPSGSSPMRCSVRRRRWRCSATSSGRGCGQASQAGARTRRLRRHPGCRGPTRWRTRSTILCLRMPTSQLRSARGRRRRRGRWPRPRRRRAPGPRPAPGPAGGGAQSAPGSCGGRPGRPS